MVGMAQQYVHTQAGQYRGHLWDQTSMVVLTVVPGRLMLCCSRCAHCLTAAGQIWMKRRRMVQEQYQQVQAATHMAVHMLVRMVLLLALALAHRMRAVPARMHLHSMHSLFTTSRSRQSGTKLVTVQLVQCQQ
jgi:hypothetical protein